MKYSLRAMVAGVFALLASTAHLRAHPGHDGDELTWDFGHLAAHPLATAGCFAVVLAVVATGWAVRRRFKRIPAAPPQSS